MEGWKDWECGLPNALEIATGRIMESLRGGVRRPPY